MIEPVQGLQVRLGTEESTTNNSSAANDTVVGSGVRRYSFFTIPSTAALYIITGIEWKNGSAVNGNAIAHVEHVDAIPPTVNQTILYAWTKSVAQTGANTVQRQSAVVSLPIPSGTIVGVSFVSDSATARYATATVSSANNSKSQAFTSSPQTGLNVAWAGTTEEPYIKLYYKAIL